MKYCQECKQQIENDKFYFYELGNYYFCSDECIASFAEKEKEKMNTNLLFHTICRIFHVNEVPKRIWAEIERFNKKEGLSNKQIASIVHYMYDIKQLTPYKDTIYLVPKYKDEAKQWYIDNQSKKEIIKNVKTKQVIPDYNHKKTFGIILNPDDV